MQFLLNLAGPGRGQDPYFEKGSGVREKRRVGTAHQHSLWRALPALLGSSRRLPQAGQKKPAPYPPLQP